MKTSSRDMPRKNPRPVVRRRVLARLDAQALVRSGASSVLAIDAQVMGKSVALYNVEPADDYRLDRGEVAVVDIEGPLAQRSSATLCGYVDGYDALSDRFSIALEDPDVSAVVLRVDSPGGDVAGLEECVRRMTEARDLFGKPVYAYVDEFAASAAYWITACVATAGVFLPTAGAVGSIGVIGFLVDETAALAKQGVAITLVRDPDGKAASDSMGPVHDLALSRMREMVSAGCERFCAAIKRARPQVSDPHGLNGEILSGARAVEAGLADGVASFEAVVRLASTGITVDNAGEDASEDEDEELATRAAQRRALKGSNMVTNTQELQETARRYGVSVESLTAARAEMKGAAMPMRPTVAQSSRTAARPSSASQELQETAQRYGVSVESLTAARAEMSR